MSADKLHWKIARVVLVLASLGLGIKIGLWSNGRGDACSASRFGR